MKLEDLKKKLIDEPTPSNLDQMQQGVTAWKTVYEAEKAKKDTDNINYLNRSDRGKFLIGVVAPLVTSIALIATLIFQISSNKNNFTLQRETQENEQWRNFLGKLDSNYGSNNQAIPILLKSFFSSQRYKNQAVEVASTICLPQIANPKYFALLFNDYSKLINSQNYFELILLTNSLNDEIGNANDALDVDSSYIKSKKQSRRDPDLFSSQSVKKKVHEDLDATYNFSEELVIADNGLARFIRLYHTSKDSILDLSGAHFFKTDFSNANLSGVDITNTEFQLVNLKNADLSGIENCDNSSFSKTAWWQAKSISPVLLKRLMKYYRYEDYDNKTPDDKTLYENWVKKMKS